MSRPTVINAKTLGDCSAPSEIVDTKNNAIHYHRSDLGRGGYRMVESLEVKNFRCFQDLKLHDLKRINLIVGLNSSGKTALLESIFITAGANPEIALRVRALRGFGQLVQISADRNAYESLWKDLFFNFDQEKTISCKLIGSPANTRSVDISYRKEEPLTLPFGTDTLESPLIIPIVFEWKDHKGELFKTQVKITEKGLTFEGVGEALPVYFFSSAATALSSPTENSNRFSELSKQGKEGRVIETLKKEFSFIKDISIQMNAGVAMLYASVSYLGDKIPIGTLSGGINKLLSLLLAIADKKQGVILIDEVENGFYHSKLPDIWRMMLEFCKSNDVQIFASTHSWECLRAAASLAEKHEKDFCLLRTERENGKCNVLQFSGKHFKQAIEQDIDPR